MIAPLKRSIETGLIESLGERQVTRCIVEVWNLFLLIFLFYPVWFSLYLPYLLLSFSIHLSLSSFVFHSPILPLILCFDHWLCILYGFPLVVSAAKSFHLSLMTPESSDIFLSMNSARGEFRKTLIVVFSFYLFWNNKNCSLYLCSLEVISLIALLLQMWCLI